MQSIGGECKRVAAKIAATLKGAGIDGSAANAAGPLESVEVAGAKRAGRGGEGDTSRWRERAWKSREGCAPRESDRDGGSASRARYQ